METTIGKLFTVSYTSKKWLFNFAKKKKKKFCLDSERSKKRTNFERSRYDFWFDPVGWIIGGFFFLIF